MKFNIRDEVRSLIEILMHYGIMIIIVFLLSRLGASPEGWLMNILLLMGYMWIDIYLLNKNLIDKKEIIFAKCINVIVLLVISNYCYGFHVFLTLGISIVITLLYWIITKKDNTINWLVIIVLLILGIVAHGYIELSRDRNNSLRDSLEYYANEINKISERMENEDSYYEDALNDIAYLEWFYFYKIQENVINGRGAASSNNSSITPMVILEVKNDRNPNREILRVVCNRFLMKVSILLQDKNITRREARQFFKEQDRKAYLYPSAKGEDFNGIFYKWIKEYDNSRDEDYKQIHYDQNTSLELPLLMMGELDFEKLEELEKDRGKIKLDEIISKFDQYDWMILESIFNAYKNSKGDHKQEIENGLMDVYYKGDYRELMIEMAKHDEDFKDLVELFRGNYMD
ncbi:hypothetical protein [Oceanirhabdus seepicola]|uniref:Uncharacterized protein n=1 Tax=Oceanirhabdus seepicola TaxID=2828781 RepID=A0A9J6P4E0_9CLOT|nr:hypothetical protein [Oceanirhabdus seepicola]MCM1990685.1 hypothetical protein [Oceanirhabdus seepicola]